MFIFIPTRDRIEHQHTFHALPTQWQENVVLVCPDNEVKDHEQNGCLAIARPKSCEYVPQVRDFIVELSGGENFIMADDDLRFARRIPGKTNLLPATPEDIDWMINSLFEAVKDPDMGMVGLSSRQGNNHLEAPWSYNTRIHAFYAVDPSILERHKIRFGDVTLMEDHRINLSLLERGYSNKALAEMCWDQASNAPGGCSTYRTTELQSRAAHRLYELHPEFVTVVVKKPKTAWKGEERHDVRIAWKKAWKAGQFHRDIMTRRAKAMELLRNA